MKNVIITGIFIISGFSCNAQVKPEKYTVGKTTWAFGEYSFINSEGDTIRKLDSGKYTFSFTDTFEIFAVFGMKGKKGWPAIDINENILFQVANIPAGEISPDVFIENKIRIVGEDGKFGFANEKGEIIIKPQFEIVSHFNNGHAIIAEDCEKRFWEPDPGNEHKEHGDCEHYSLECKKYGFIDTAGVIIKLGNFTFDEIQKEISWKAYEY
jgi:hypothetical protein